MLGAAAVLASYGAAALLLTAGLALALVLPPWLSALVVAVALFLIAGLFALLAKRHFSRVPPLAPTDTVKSVQADVEAITSAGGKDHEA